MYDRWMDVLVRFCWNFLYPRPNLGLLPFRIRRRCAPAPDARKELGPGDPLQAAAFVSFLRCRQLEQMPVIRRGVPLIARPLVARPLASFSGTSRSAAGRSRYRRPAWYRTLEPAIQRARPPSPTPTACAAPPPS